MPLLSAPFLHPSATTQGKRWKETDVVVADGIKLGGIKSGLNGLLEEKWATRAALGPVDFNSQNPSASLEFWELESTGSKAALVAQP